MRKSTLQRATALLIGAGALLAATTTGASATTASEYAAKAKPIVRTMPKAEAKALKSAPAAAAAAPISARINPGQKLTPGTTISAGVTNLVMQWDGNLVLYLVAENGTQIQALWSSGTWGNWASYAVMQNDGNFVVYKENGGEGKGGATWSSNSWGHTGTYALMSWGALLVGSDTDSKPYWQTETGFIPAKNASGQWTDLPSNTLASKQGLFENNWIESEKTILIQQADGNLVLYRKSDGRAIWGSGTYGHPNSLTYMDEDGLLVIVDDNNLYWHSNTAGNYGAYATAQNDGNFVVYKYDGGPTKGGALWSSGTWGKA